MSEVTALSLAPLAATFGVTRISHIAALGHGGTDDDDIPALCRDQDYAALISLNVRDFGARLHYYAALLDAGIHVAVVRAPKLRMTPANQISVLSPHLQRIMQIWVAAEQPTLIKVTQSRARAVPLNDLVAKIEGKRLP